MPHAPHSRAHPLKRASRSDQQAPGRGGAPERGPRRISPAAAYLLKAGSGLLVVLWLPARFPQVEHRAIEATVFCLRAGFAAIGDPVSVVGNTLTLRHFSFTIVPDCTPLMPTLLAAIAILAFPSPWRARAWGLGAAVAVLWFYNLFRIMALMGLTVVWPGAFEFAHVYLWQTVTLVVVVGTVVTWMRFAVRATR